MSSIKEERRIYLLWMAAASLIVTIAIGLHSYSIMTSTALHCLAQKVGPCNAFVPWMWLAVASAAISLASATGYYVAALGRHVWFRLLVSMLALVVLGAAMYLHFKVRVDGSQGEPTVSGLPAEQSMVDRARQAQLGASASPGAAVPAVHPFPEIPKTRDGLALESDPFIATSIEEQAWLDRNGYPNEPQWAAYSQATEMQLREAAATGDKAAKVILLHRQLMAGDDSAINELFNEGVSGSGFALDMLASFLASSRGSDRSTAYAVSRVSEMRGNLRVAIARDLMFDSPLTQDERRQGEKAALEIYSALASQQKKERPNSSPVDPRPIGG